MKIWIVYSTTKRFKCEFFFEIRYVGSKFDLQTVFKNNCFDVSIAKQNMDNLFYLKRSTA
jgi:hypothetical protein